MKLLISSAASPLAATLAAGLDDEHSLRLTEVRQVDCEYEFAVSPLGHDASTHDLVSGVEAIVHVAEPLAGSASVDQIDYLTRCTYNLLLAAAEEGVSRVVLLSTLALMSGYDPIYKVTERWRPLPTPDAAILGKQLCEHTCREFAREHRLQVVVLRLGAVVFDGQNDGASNDPTSIAASDLVQAVERALVTPLTSQWSVFHIQSESPGARFSIGDAKSALAFAPQVEFSR